MFNKVVKFYQKFGIDYDGPPRPLPAPLATDRINFLNEECQEYYDAYTNNNMEGMLDALVDLVYVALGTAHLHGFDFEEAFKRVHAANMKKEINYELVNGKFGIVKPEGWKPPFLTDLVRNSYNVE